MTARRRWRWRLLRRAAFLALLLHLVAGVAPATAAPGYLAPFIPIAEAAWPGPQCDGIATYDAVPRETLPKVDPFRPGARVLGYADPAGCHIYVTDELTAATGQLAIACTIAVHERGHLELGAGHSDDPLNIMFPIPLTWWACADFAVPVAVQSYSQGTTGPGLDWAPTHHQKGRSG